MISTLVPHKYTQQKAKEKIEILLAKCTPVYNLAVNWNSTYIEIQTPPKENPFIAGKLKITPSDFEIELTSSKGVIAEMKHIRNLTKILKEL